MHSFDERYFRTDDAEPGHRVFSFLTCRLAHSIPFSARQELIGYKLHCEQLLHEPTQNTFQRDDQPAAVRRSSFRKQSSCQPQSDKMSSPISAMAPSGVSGFLQEPASRSEAFAAQLFRFWDAVLDTSPGPAWLVHPAVADFTQVTLHAMEGILCRLEGYVILPTHVHVLYSQDVHLNRGPAPLHVADGLKTPVAHFASRILDLRGPFWQDADYHRILRSEKEIESVKSYIRRDPVRAGLVKQPKEWLWAWERGE